jgi:hypothetical protein
MNDRVMFRLALTTLITVGVFGVAAIGMAILAVGKHPLVIIGMVLAIWILLFLVWWLIRDIRGETNR